MAILKIYLQKGPILKNSVPGKFPICGILMLHILYMANHLREETFLVVETPNHL